MKIAILLVCVILPGCFAAQYDTINRRAEERTRALDEQCKSHMTDWCAMQYALIQRQREVDLDDVQRRREATAEAIRHSGDGFRDINKNK